MHFGAPHILPWLFVVVVLAWLLVLYRRWQAQALQAWASPRFLKMWKARAPWWLILLSDGFLCLAIAAMLLALARPQWGWTQGKVTQKGMEIVVILDVSPSMYLADVRPTRWHRAVFALHAFAERLAGDRLALVAFDGQAGLQSPFTDDITALRELAWYSRPGLFPSQGEGLAAALNLARKQLQPRRSMHDARAVVLLTDGEPSRSTKALREARALQQSKIAFFVVGVGGSRAPRAGSPALRPGTDKRPWLQQQSQTTLPPWRPLPTQALQQLTKAGSGWYSTLSQEGNGLQGVRQKLLQMQRSNRSQRQRKKPIERYPIALGLAVLFLALHRILQV